MVVLFLFCHIPRFVANAVELIFLDPAAAQTHRVSRFSTGALCMCMGSLVWDMQI